MRDVEHLEKFRVVNGPMASTPEAGNNGMFLIPHQKYAKDRFQVTCSDGMGWEVVSFTYYKKNKTPTWDDSCYIKDLFWEEEEAVMQLHRPASLRVSERKFVIALMRPIEVEIPQPPVITLGAVTAEKA